MPAYNFQKQFAGPVERGEKRQTIRQTARGARPGATAYLFYGLRTKQCRRLGQSQITDVAPIEIDYNGGEPYACLGDYPHETTLVHNDLDALARADGFASADEMVDWFAGRYGLPFSGFLIRWK